MTDTSVPSPSSTGRRRAAQDREFRRIRILAMASAGWSYAAIGRQEAISRQRVRQIVARAIEAAENETRRADAGARERLLAKLNIMADASSRTAAPRLARATRQSPKPPLTRPTALLSLTNPPRRQAPGLTLLDKT